MKFLLKPTAGWRYLAASCILCTALHTNAQDFSRWYDVYSSTTHVSNALEMSYRESGHLWGGWKAYNPNAEKDYNANGGNTVKSGTMSPWVMHTDMMGRFSPYIPYGAHTFSNTYKFQRGGSDIIVTSARVAQGYYEGFNYVCVNNIGEYNIGMLYMNLDDAGNVSFSQGYTFNSGVTAAEIVDIKTTIAGAVVLAKLHYGNATKILAAKIDGFGRIVWSNEYDINPVAPLTEAVENPKTLFWDWFHHHLIIGGDAQFLSAKPEDAFMLVLDEASGGIVQTLRFPMPGLYGGDAGSTLSDIEISVNSVTHLADYICTGHVRDVHIMPWVLRVQRDPFPTNITGSWVYDLPVNSGTHPFYWYGEGTNIDQAEPNQSDPGTWSYRMAGDIYPNNDPTASRGSFMMNIDNSGNASMMFIHYRGFLSYEFTKGMGRSLVTTAFPSLNVSAVYSTYDDGHDRNPMMINNITPSICNSDSEPVNTNAVQPGITLFGVTVTPALAVSPVRYISMCSDTSYVSCEAFYKSATAGIAEANNNMQPTISQDAVTNDVRVVMPDNESYKGKLVNSLGQTVQQYEAVGKNFKISIRDIAPGIYYLQLANQRNQFAKMVIVR